MNAFSGYTRDELIERFNPEPVNNDRFIEAITSEHPLDRAENIYDLRWKGFVDSLGLPDGERNRLRELLIAHDAHNLELSDLVMTGQISGAEHIAARRSLEQLAESLKTMLSEDQIALFRDQNERRSDRLRRGHAEMDAQNLENGVVGILDAAYRGDAATVLAYINSGADLNARTVDGNFTPLHYAITHGNVEIARILLQAGADPNLPTANEIQATPLAKAANKGDIEIIRALIAAGADPDFVPNSPGLAPLPGAASKGKTAAVAVLLELGADATGKAGVPGAYSCRPLRQPQNGTDIDRRGSEGRSSYRCRPRFQGNRPPPGSGTRLTARKHAIERESSDSLFFAGPTGNPNVTGG